MLWSWALGVILTFPRLLLSRGLNDSFRGVYRGAAAPGGAKGIRGLHTASAAAGGDPEADGHRG